MVSLEWCLCFPEMGGLGEREIFPVCYQGKLTRQLNLKIPSKIMLF